MMTKYFASKDEKSAFATVTAGIIFSLSLSVPIVVFFFVFRSKLGFIFTDERCMDVLMIVLPGLIITSVYAVIRGFFWGKKSFLTYSLIELAEEAVMLVAGVVLIGAVTSKMSGVEKAAWAVLISYAFSFAAASAVFFIKGGRLISPKNTLKPLAKSSAPITGMRTATSLINSLIAIILPLRLISAGLTRTEAMAEFGAAFGMAIPILFMPATLIGSLAVVLVPELSENYYKNQKENLINNVERALKFSFFVACIIIPVLVSFGKNLGIFFYSSGEAGKYLTYAAPVMLPMSICMITTSMLNSLNCERRTLVFYLCGAAFMLACVFLLPRYIGVYSLIAGMLGQYLITAVLNYFAIRKKLGEKMYVNRFFVKAFLFMIPTILFGIMLNRILSAIVVNAVVCIAGSILTALFGFAFYPVFGMADFIRRSAPSADSKTPR